MKVLVAGIIARYPFGGVTWCSLMYLLGLRALGHEVLYIEDTGECIYDPEQNTRSEDPSYGTRYIHNALEPFGLGDRWSFVNYDASYHGVSHEQVKAFCADAELFINLSGGAWFWRDEYVKIPRKVFIDSDPVFTQLAIAKAEGWYVEFFHGFGTEALVTARGPPFGHEADDGAEERTGAHGGIDDGDALVGESLVAIEFQAQDFVDEADHFVDEGCRRVVSTRRLAEVGVVLL